MGCTHSSSADAKPSSSVETSNVALEPDEPSIKPLSVIAHVETEDSIIESISIDRVSHCPLTSILHTYWYYFTKENECRRRNDRIHAEMLRRCRPFVLKVPVKETSPSAMEFSWSSESSSLSLHSSQEMHNHKSEFNAGGSNYNSAIIHDNNFKLYSRLDLSSFDDSCDLHAHDALFEHEPYDSSHNNNNISEVVKLNLHNNAQHCLLSLGEIDMAMEKFNEYVQSEYDALDWRVTVHYHVNTPQEIKHKSNDKSKCNDNNYNNNNIGSNTLLKEECKFAVCHLRGEVCFKDAANTSFVIPFKFAVVVPYQPEVESEDNTILRV